MSNLACLPRTSNNVFRITAAQYRQKNMICNEGVEYHSDM